MTPTWKSLIQKTLEPVDFTGFHNTYPVSLFMYSIYLCVDFPKKHTSLQSSKIKGCEVLSHFSYYVYSAEWCLVLWMSDFYWIYGLSGGTSRFSYCVYNIFMCWLKKRENRTVDNCWFYGLFRHISYFSYYVYRWYL